MKYFQSESTYKYRWDQVAVGFWRRYPNPYSKHVLSVDVVERHIAPDGTLRSKRLLVKTGRAPRWAERVLSLPKFVYVIEESIVDVHRRILTTYTRNIAHQKFMTIDEKVVYSPAAEDPARATVERREAWINSTMRFGLGDAAQMFGYERFKRNVNKTLKGFHFVMEEMCAVRNGTSTSSSGGSGSGSTTATGPGGCSGTPSGNSGQSTPSGGSCGGHGEPAAVPARPHIKIQNPN